QMRAGRVEDVLSSLLPAELLVVNPPRGGLHEDVPRQVLDAPPARMIYVSCDPATLARDLKRLSDRYTLEGLRAFDLFPQTAHVETVAELSLRSTSE
ncbi:MAG: 23S rRNA (uracil(1939)-C(5))-methyltransferase RlmD, partial [Longimicrobiales bacterium]